MPWFYVDDQMADSKPVLAMPDRYRLAACGLWLLAGSWSAREKLDGYVPKGKLRQLLADTRQPLVEILKSTDGTYEPLWEDGRDGGGQLTQWDRWQPNAAQMRRKRDANAARLREWRKRNPDQPARANKRGRAHVGSEDTDDGISGSVNDGAPANLCNALQTDTPIPIPLVVTLGGDSAVGSEHSRNGADAPPPPTCPEHSNPDHPAPCRACQRVRQYRDSEALKVREERVQAERKRSEWERGIHRCQLCNDTGMIFRPGLYVRCPHRADEYRRILQQWEAEQHTEGAHA